MVCLGCNAATTTVGFSEGAPPSTGQCNPGTHAVVSRLLAARCLQRGLHQESLGGLLGLEAHPPPWAVQPLRAIVQLPQALAVAALATGQVKLRNPRHRLPDRHH